MSISMDCPACDAHFRASDSAARRSSARNARHWSRCRCLLTTRTSLRKRKNGRPPPPGNARSPRTMGRSRGNIRAESRRRSPISPMILGIAGVGLLLVGLPSGVSSGGSPAARNRIRRPADLVLDTDHGHQRTRQGKTRGENRQQTTATGQSSPFAQPAGERGL